MEQTCVFCDRSKLEQRLIWENDKFSVVASLGQITDGGYVLIIPKGHIDCIAEMHDTKVGSFLNLVDDVCEAIEKEYGQKAAMFEHGGVGQSIKHAHLHIFPGSDTIKLTKMVKTDFPLTDWNTLWDFHNLFELYERRPEPYLFWKSEDGIPYAYWNPPAPPQYFRTALAKLLNRPERANWREMDPELDKKLCEETVKRLKPYFQKPTPL